MPRRARAIAPLAWSRRREGRRAPLPRDRVLRRACGGVAVRARLRPGGEVRVAGASAATSRGGVDAAPRGARRCSAARRPRGPWPARWPAALRAAARSSGAAVAVWLPSGRAGPSAAPGRSDRSAPARLRRARPGVHVPRGRRAPRHGEARRRLPRRGPAALGASRLAARLTARGLPAAARGRLAWLRVDDHPVAAAVAVRRAAGALDVPLVAVLGGPRCEVIEGLIEEQDLVLVVGEPDGPLVRLAVGSCAGAAVAHGACAPGPPRWLALAGLAGAHGLTGPVRGLVRELAAPHTVEEATW